MPTATRPRISTTMPTSPVFLELEFEDQPGARELGGQRGHCRDHLANVLARGVKHGGEPGRHRGGWARRRSAGALVGRWRRCSLGVLRRKPCLHVGIGEQPDQRVDLVGGRRRLRRCVAGGEHPAKQAGREKHAAKAKLKAERSYRRQPRDPPASRDRRTAIHI